MKAKAQEGHKRDVDGLRQELFDLTKKAAESRQKENWGDDSEDGEPSGSKEVAILLSLPLSLFPVS